MRIHVKLKWEDMWIGLFVKRYSNPLPNTPRLDLFVCLVPMIRIRLRWMA